MAPPTPGIGNVIDNTPLITMAMAYSRSRILCAAARLGIADALADETLPLAQLASACNANPDALYRLLRALAAIGITEETTPEHFRLTPFGQPLRKDAPNSVWPSVIFWSDLLADSWNYLPDCIRTGKPAQEIRPPNIPSRWSQDPEASNIFRAVMGTAPAEDYAPIAAAYDFTSAHTVADLGGGGGSLILAVLARNPHLRGLLVDLEPSIESARPRFSAPTHADDPAARTQLIPADLLQTVPPGADIYMLKHVLHGRRDPEAITILKNVRAIIPPTGSLLIIEFVLPTLISHPDPALEGQLMSDLNMLAVTGGKERSEHQWKQLLDASNFALRAVHPVGDPHAPTRNVAIVEAAPVTR
ncbi:MAG: methyltransferase [Acidobacteriaceae bacterium]